MKAIYDMIGTTLRLQDLDSRFSTSKHDSIFQVAPSEIDNWTYTVGGKNYTFYFADVIPWALPPQDIVVIIADVHEESNCPPACF